MIVHRYLHGVESDPIITLGLELIGRQHRFEVNSRQGVLEFELPPVCTCLFLLVACRLRIDIQQVDLIVYIVAEREFKQRVAATVPIRFALVSNLSYTKLSFLTAVRCVCT